MRAAAGNTPDLSERHQNLLAERGISMETAQAAGLRSASAREASSILGFDPRSAGLLIPYRHPVTGDIRTYRFRPDTPPVISGKPAKYLSPRGVSNLLYFPPDVAPLLRDAATPVILTEGELKALSVWQAGLLTIATSGVWNWRCRTDGASQPLPDFDLLDVRGRCVTIVFDSDVALNDQVKKARHALGKELYRRNASRVFAVDLPAADGLKLGLDDFLARHGLDAYQNLDAFELPPTDIPLPSEPLSAMLLGPDEPLEWGIEGIQAIGANTWRIAGPKVGKSWHMGEETYCLTTGTPLYGKFAVPERRRVLLIEEEDPRRRLRGRLGRIISAHGGQMPDDKFFRVITKKGVTLNDPAWQEVIEYEVKTFRPHFVYLDVFLRLHTEDPIDTQAMAALVRFFDRLNREYGCAFVILHHDRKGKQGDSYDDILGSRVLGGFADGALFFSRTREKGVLRVEVSLKDEPEDGNFEPEFLVHLRDTDDGTGTTFEYIGNPAEKRAESDFRAKVLEQVRVDWRTVAEVAEALKKSKPTVRDTLNALVDLHLVERDGSHQKHRYRAKPENPKNEEILH